MVAVTISVPVFHGQNYSGAFSRTSAALSSPSFASNLGSTLVRYGAPLFVSGGATPFVNSFGSVVDVSTVFVPVITKSPAPTGQPSGAPSAIPTQVPTAAPSIQPTRYIKPPLLTPEQIFILVAAAVVLGAVGTLVAIAYLLFFRCYLVDRRNKAKSLLKRRKNVYVLDLPEEKAEEVEVVVQAERVLNKKEKAKLREQHRQKAELLLLKAKPGTADSDLHFDQGLGSASAGAAGAAGAIGRTPWWCLGSRRVKARGGDVYAAEESKDEFDEVADLRLTIRLDDDEEEEEEGGREQEEGSEDGQIAGGKGRGKKKKRRPKKSPKQQRVAPAGSDSDDGSHRSGDSRQARGTLSAAAAAAALATKPGDGKSSNQAFPTLASPARLPPLAPPPSGLSLPSSKPTTPLVVISRQQTVQTRKERLAEKKAQKVMEQLKAAREAMNRGDGVQWETLGEEGAKAKEEFAGLTQEERRAKARAIAQEIEAKKRFEQVVVSLDRYYAARRDAALQARFTPFDATHRLASRKQPPTTVGLFDQDLESKRRNIVSRRLDARAAEQRNRLEAGAEDPVLVNAGPPASIIPPGYRLASSVPSVTIASLAHRRVMIMWNEETAKGWFCGRVSAVTNRPGYNFNVKYDKEEVSNIAVEGIHTAMLGLTGEHAYGRHWVLLEAEGEEAPLDLDLPMPLGESSNGAIDWADMV